MKWRYTHITDPHSAMRRYPHQLILSGLGDSDTFHFRQHEINRWCIRMFGYEWINVNYSYYFKTQEDTNWFIMRLQDG